MLPFFFFSSLCPSSVDGWWWLFSWLQDGFNRLMKKSSDEKGDFFRVTLANRLFWLTSFGGIVSPALGCGPGAFLPVFFLWPGKMLPLLRMLPASHLRATWVCLQWKMMVVGEDWAARMYGLLPWLKVLKFLKDSRWQFLKKENLPYSTLHSLPQ